MDRRGFFKILSATSAGIATTACGHKSDALIPMLVPEHEIVPGVEQWHPAVCTECAAGCATLVRVMEGVRTIERNGEKFRERIAAVKKIEGNPSDPVSGGRLCARGQSSVQSLYHPDRLRGPMRRTGGKLTPVSWDEAIASASEILGRADRSRIAFYIGPHVGTRSLSIARFLEALGAPAPIACSLPDLAAEQRAAEQVFGWKGLPVYDLARAHTVLGVGADFLGGWTSPVYYARQYGAFRQGRPTVRGRLFHAESRLSLTAASADRWIPLRPATEEAFLAAVGRLLFDSAFPSVDATALLKACGADERRVREAVAELKESPAPLIVSGLPLAHHLNSMLGNVGKPGGLLPPGAERPTVAAAVANPQVVLVDSANPAYTQPGSLDHAENVISFARFLDESAAHAALILPDHHALESEMAVVPAVAPQQTVSIGTPFIRPLYDTRAVEKTLGDIAKKLNVEYHAATVKEQWGGTPGTPTLKPLSPLPAAAAPPAYHPDDLVFQAYPSLQFGDGSTPGVPWLHELPDPASSAIWGLPVEIDPQTATRYGIATGDTVRVESPHAGIEAPAYVHPGAVPGVLSMAIGGGRGPNPLTLLDGAAYTRVRLARVGPSRNFIQFAAPDREEITRR